MKSESNVSIAPSPHGIRTNYLSITLLLFDSPYVINNEERPSSSTYVLFFQTYLSSFSSSRPCAHTHFFFRRFIPLLVREKNEILYLDDNDDDRDALHLTATGEVQQ